MTEDRRIGLYGFPPADLMDLAEPAIQFSPLVPGAAALEEWNDGTFASIVMLAPPGVVERRYALAQALRLLPVGSPLTVMAPKLKGGSRLRKELETFGCAVAETARRHHRICVCQRPAAIIGLDEALANGGSRFIDEIGFWSQPGVFSWDRIDPVPTEHARLRGSGAAFARLGWARRGFRLRLRLSGPGGSGLAESRDFDLDRHRPSRDRCRKA
jgi:16S rRNA (guanine1207-N2)-methyltransferase